jgi:large subunit ribosomal protein L25
MSKIQILKAEERSVLGTGAARELRRRNMVPAIVYGAGKEQVLMSLSSKEITLQYRKQGFLSHIFDIQVGKITYRALPKDIQLHPVTDEIEHIDFIHINENEKIKANITLQFVNEAKCPGIKQGGILNIVRHSLEIYCLPNNIPEFIEIDAAELSLGQTIHVSDLVLPKGIETKVDPEATIAAIVGGKASAEESSSEAGK